MKTLTPWKRAGSSAPAEARLLDGRRIPSRMPDEARERLAARLFGPASLAARPAPESTRPSTASGLRPKPIIAAIIAVGFGFTAFVTERAVPPPSAPTSPHFATTPAASATAHTAHEEEPSPLPVFSIDEIPNVPPPRPPPTPKVVDAPDTLLREIALVDDARSKSWSNTGASTAAVSSRSNATCCGSRRSWASVVATKPSASARAFRVAQRAPPTPSAPPPSSRGRAARSQTLFRPRADLLKELGARHISTVVATTNPTPTPWTWVARTNGATVSGDESR